MNSVIMHVNYGEIGYNAYGTNTVEDICRLAAEVGFDGVEFREKPPRELSATVSVPEYIQQIRAGKEKYGLTEMMLGLSVKDSMSTDSNTRMQAVQETVAIAKMAHDVLGTTLCNCVAANVLSPIVTNTRMGVEFNGSAAATQEQWDLTVDTFQRIGKELEAVGVRLAFETHMNYIHDLPAAAMELVRQINSPMIGINMDFGNTVYFPKYPTVEQTIDLYADKLFYIHLKNSSPIPDGRIPTALSDGQINHRAYLKKLRAVGFAGPIGIEAPRPGDRAWFAHQDFSYYQAVAQSL